MWCFIQEPFKYIYLKISCWAMSAWTAYNPHTNSCKIGLSSSSSAQKLSLSLCLWLSYSPPIRLSYVCAPVAVHQQELLLFTSPSCCLYLLTVSGNQGNWSQSLLWCQEWNTCCVRVCACGTHTHTHTHTNLLPLSSSLTSCDASHMVSRQAAQ